MSSHALRGIRTWMMYTTKMFILAVVVIALKQMSDISLGDPTLLIPHEYPQYAKSSAPQFVVCVIILKNDVPALDALTKDLAREVGAGLPSSLHGIFLGGFQCASSVVVAGRLG